MRIESRTRTPDEPLDVDRRSGTDLRKASPERRELPPPPDTPDRLAFFTGLGMHATTAVDAAGAVRPGDRDTVVGRRLDALRDRFAGPYVVDGATVTARPMFRMNEGANERSAKAHAKELDVIAARARVNVVMVRLGQGSPRDLVKITQALIDAGKLPPPPGEVATRIRRMQWEWGIGVDCAGYTYQAAVAASGVGAGQLGLKPPGFEDFRAMGDPAKRFAKIDPTLARPGDVMTLDPQPPEKVGHNVIVRSHTTTGTLHVFEVDSSWGAGPDGADYGGFRRDTWTYDDATKLWTWTNNHVSPPTTEVSLDGPAGERFHGCYRPKVGT